MSPIFFLKLLLLSSLSSTSGSDDNGSGNSNDDGCDNNNGGNDNGGSRSCSLPQLSSTAAATANSSDSSSDDSRHLLLQWRQQQQQEAAVAVMSLLGSEFGGIFWLRIKGWDFFFQIILCNFVIKSWAHQAKYGAHLATRIFKTDGDLTLIYMIRAPQFWFHNFQFFETFHWISASRDLGTLFLSLSSSINPGKIHFSFFILIFFD